MHFVHTLTATLALIFGAWNFFARKGTRLHRRVGWGYVVSMGVMLFTSFFIFDLFGGFGPFHAASLMSGITLGLALYFPLRRQRYANWVEHHYWWIAYSYVGLVMAGGSHLFGLVDWPVGVQAAVFWGMPYAVGTALIYARRNHTLATARRKVAA